MRLPFVSRDKYEDKLQELYIKQKMLDNTYELLNEATERNFKLSMERIEIEKRAIKYEDWYKNLNTVYKQAQSDLSCYQTLIDRKDTELERGKNRENDLLEINKKLREKIELFGIEVFFRLKKQALNKKKVRLKKKKNKQLNDYLIKEVVTKIYE